MCMTDLKISEFLQQTINVIMEFFSRNMFKMIACKIRNYHFVHSWIILNDLMNAQFKCGLK